VNQWFRFYSEVLEDPKVQRLPRELFRTWVNCLCLASRLDGVLPAIADIAFALRLPEKEAAKRIAALTSAGLFDRDGEALHPHNWKGRQFQSDGSSERVKRFRARKGNVACNVSETAMETARDASGNVAETAVETGPDSETDTDTERSSSSVRANPMRIDDDDFANQIEKAAGSRAPLRRTGLGALARLLGEGCDPQHDVLPEIAEVASKLSEPLGSWGVGWLLAQIRMRSRERLRPKYRLDGAAIATSIEERLFVELNSRDWPCAVARYMKENRRAPPTQREQGGGIRVGWYFPKSWLESDEAAIEPLEAAE
jgi:hypothetical protein